MFRFILSQHILIRSCQDKNSKIKKQVVMIKCQLFYILYYIFRTRLNFGESSMKVDSRSSSPLTALKSTDMDIFLDEEVAKVRKAQFILQIFGEQIFFVDFVVERIPVHVN